MEEKNQTSFEDEKIIEIPKISLNSERQLKKLDILRKLSSGTGLREALNDIVNGGTGAIIMIDNPNASGVFIGGFKVNCKFIPKRLVELAKMDGAIILSDDFRKIIYANTLLVPDSSLDTTETGIRHQAAERTAKQINGLVITISQRRGDITVYYGNSKYVLQNTEDLLRRATETLQILEKQREIFDELLTNLNVLEMTHLVSIVDVCTVLQRLEMMKKMANIINEHIIELGKEGTIVRMRMREIVKGIERERDDLVKDYFPRPKRVLQFLESLNFDELLDTGNIAKFLFALPFDKGVVPKGYRILNKTTLDKNKIKILIETLKNLEGIMDAEEEILSSIFGEDLEDFKKEMNNLRDQIMVGRKI